LTSCPGVYPHADFGAAGGVGRLEPRMVWIEQTVNTTLVDGEKDNRLCSTSERVVPLHVERNELDARLVWI
jgi:hypothetical protein